MENMSACETCGYMFPWEDIGNPPRKTCPDCGSPNRNYTKTITDRIELNAEATVQTTQQRNQRPPTDISDEPTNEQGG
jgi:PHP family Zn ribbon phosphoesterase